MLSRSDGLPKISFGIIVLNGMPFLPYCLRSIYPFAHEILIVEGAVPDAWESSTSTGHSKDQTLNSIHTFIRDEDPEKKVRLIQAEDPPKGPKRTNGFWPGEKDEMSQAFAEVATGDWLWQVDTDEFYHPDEVQRLFSYLKAHPQIEMVTFPTLHFWGGFDVYCDGYYLRRGGAQYHRLFRWKPGYRYTTHRPPTVIDENGVNLQNKGWLPARKTQKLGVWLYHYCLVFPEQVRQKTAYYEAAEWSRRAGAMNWFEDTFIQLKNPFQVHNVLDRKSWLVLFRRDHPPQIQSLIRDLQDRKIEVVVRRTADIQKLMQDQLYQLLVFWHSFWERLERWTLRSLSLCRRWIHRAEI